tara:strand:+ start:6860 stop:7747 length:888 start_codon:yes stop_codon:yes gene_type:complete
MISILIPVYNYNITHLVIEIHKQLSISDVDFEILCLEDGSDNEYVKQNKTINTLTNTKQVISKINVGRISTRQLLCNEAKYSWLLFLDADVIPKKSHFISDYINLINSKYEAIFGGFTYSSEKPGSNYMLRWTYGKNNEEVLSSKRNKNPYKVIISANFLIRKTVFDQINSQIKGNAYGFDNYFATLLKSEKIKILHIDNEVYHKGIETNACYLEKKEAAAKTLLTLYKSGKTQNHDNDLLGLFIKLKSYKLNYLFVLFYKLFHNILRKNILSSNPSIKLLQLYRICFMCYTDLN